MSPWTRNLPYKLGLPTTIDKHSLRFCFCHLPIFVPSDQLVYPPLGLLLYEAVHGHFVSY